MWSNLIISFISIVITGIILSLVFGIYLTVDIGDPLPSPTPTPTPVEQSFDIENLDGPNIVTEHAIARWGGAVNTLQNSDVLISDNGLLSVPGGITAGTSSRIQELSIVSGLKTMTFNLSAIQDNTTRTIIMPDSNVNLSSLARDVVTVPGDYPTVIAAINDSQTHIEVVSDTEETQTLTGGVTSLSSIHIVVGGAVTYDWGDHILAFSLPHASLFIEGLGNSTDTTVNTPSAGSSVMHFNCAVTFVNVTGPNVVRVFMSNIDIDCSISGTATLFDGDVVPQMSDTSVYVPSSPDIYKMGTTVNPGFTRDCYFFQKTAAGAVSSVVNMENLQVENTWFIGLDEVVADTVEFRGCVLDLGSDLDATNSVIDNMVSLSGSVVKLDDNCTFINATTQIDVFIKGANVKIADSNIKSITFDTPVTAGVNLSIDLCELQLNNLTFLPLMTSVFITNCSIFATSILVNSPSINMNANTIDVGSFVVNGSAATITGNDFRGTSVGSTISITGDNACIVGGEMIAQATVALSGENGTISGVRIVSPATTMDGIFWTATGSIFESPLVINTVGNANIVLSGCQFKNDLTIDTSRVAITGSSVLGDCLFVAGTSATCTMSTSLITGTLTANSAKVDGSNIA